MFLFICGTVTLVVTCLATAVAHAEPHDSFTEPYRKIDLAPAESGVVAEIAVREGAEVKAGQILAALDKDVLMIARDIAQFATTAEGRSKASQADYRLKEARLRKIRELQSQGHASPGEVERAEAEFESAAGNSRIVEEQRQLDRLELKKTEAMIERRLIRSPIDGIVTKLHREQGEFVTPVSPVVVTVVQIHPLRRHFQPLAHRRQRLEGRRFGETDISGYQSRHDRQNRIRRPRLRCGKRHDPSEGVDRRQPRQTLGGKSLLAHS